MNELQLTPLHPQFGVEVLGVDLRTLTPTHLYPEVRAAFEEHSLLVFRNQQVDNDEAHLAFGSLWGPIEDRAYGAMGDAPRMDNVTNRLADNTIAAADDLHTLNLLGNQLWHTDSTFLPVPALANILAARVLSDTGGETEFVSTRAAWRDLPAALRDRIGGRVIRHRLAHSRAKISPMLEAQHRAKWPDQTWPAVLTNAVNGAEALYIASHSCGIEGMPDDEAQPLLEELIDFCTQPERIYSHQWRLGDVLVWDERATMHRGRPWPYEQERTLASICISVTNADGLNVSSTPQL
jgi:alpha-ketoglutarate-dependent 2,4-dichlorophenoxyacetate dioxygenase